MVLQTSEGIFIISKLMSSAINISKCARIPESRAKTTWLKWKLVYIENGVRGFSWENFANLLAFASNSRWVLKVVCIWISDYLLPLKVNFILSIQVVQLDGTGNDCYVFTYTAKVTILFFLSGGMGPIQLTRKWIAEVDWKSIAEKFFHKNYGNRWIIADVMLHPRHAFVC